MRLLVYYRTPTARTAHSAAEPKKLEKNFLSMSPFEKLHQKCKIRFSDPNPYESACLSKVDPDIGRN